MTVRWKTTSCRKILPIMMPLHNSAGHRMAMFTAIVALLSIGRPAAQAAEAEAGRRVRVGPAQAY